MKKLSQINENIFDGIGKRSKGGKVRKEDYNKIKELIRSIAKISCYKENDDIIICEKNGELIIDIEGDYKIEPFFMKKLNLNKLPFHINSVSGDFSCSGCGSLTSLEGAPKEVGGSFSCGDCESLTSLEGAPKEVGGSFSCSNCSSLTSLEGCPEKVGGSFFCQSCFKITSLKGAPKEVGGSFICKGCSLLSSLEGAPQKVNTFNCDFCDKITSLKGAPQIVNNDFSCYICYGLTSLEGAPKEVGKNFVCKGCKGKFTEEDVRKVCNVGGKVS